MEKELLLKQLVDIGITEIEAKIYLHLLKKPGENPTQVSKEVDISRSISYKYMQKMEEKGMLKLIPAQDDSKNYVVINPNIYFAEYEKNFLNNINNLKFTLDSMYNKYNREGMYLFDRIDNLTYKVIDLINSAENIIVVIGNIYDEVIREKLKKIEEKSILVYILEDISSDEFIIIKDNVEMVLKDSLNMIYTKNSLLINQISKRIKMEMEKKK
ncbi:hypothetical protein HP397_00520 [Streptobacillus felis]|uniref:Transcription regulator TrmB N-terminal domain-containing protein n=1 Tax=Streptobacillus felis TaxID=1384509 RepID=A0A7Z0PDP6_9FUSO|nr:helix-turn-helix domain-containing protein [Streptobacillus felis]NYV27311.1 hypothetical protein [Streptobacillus felis]